MATIRVLNRTTQTLDASHVNGVVLQPGINVVEEELFEELVRLTEGRETGFARRLEEGLLEVLKDGGEPEPEAEPEVAPEQAKAASELAEMEYAELYKFAREELGLKFRKRPSFEELRAAVAEHLE